MQTRYRPAGYKAHQGQMGCLVTMAPGDDVGKYLLLEDNLELAREAYPGWAVAGVRFNGWSVNPKVFRQSRG